MRILFLRLQLLLQLPFCLCLHLLHLLPFLNQPVLLGSLPWPVSPKVLGLLLPIWAFLLLLRRSCRLLPLNLRFLRCLPELFRELKRLQMRFLFQFLRLRARRRRRRRKRLFLLWERRPRLRRRIDSLCIPSMRAGSLETAGKCCRGLRLLPTIGRKVQSDSEADPFRALE